MSKVSIGEIDNIHSTGAATTINSNFLAIQTIIDGLLSRTGLSPNFMDAALDMNGYNIINVGTITTTDGTGGTGSTYGLLYDGTDQGTELQAVLTGAGETALTYGPQVVKLVSNEGPLKIGSRVKVPSNVTLDTSLITINFVDQGELAIYGDYSELPESSLFRLAADAEPGDTAITVDASDYGSYTLLAVDALIVLRGENDENGTAIQRYEGRISAVNDSGGISSLVLTIDPPIPDDQGTFTPINAGSAWAPGESGIDRSLITVKTSSLIDSNVARGDNSFDVADGTKFAEGDMVLVQDDRLASDPGTPTKGQPTRQEPSKILDITSNTITFDRRLSRDFLTSENAALVKVVPIFNAHIIGGLFERITAPDETVGRKHIAQIALGSKCSISGIFLVEDDHTYSVLGSAGRLTRSIDCEIFNCVRVGPKNVDGGEGYGFANYYSTDSKIYNNYTSRCRHGFVNQGSTRAKRFNNIGVDNLINTLDDHGVYETDSYDYSNTAIGGTTLASDSTQQLGATFGNTRWHEGSHWAVSRNNHFIGFSGASDGGIAVRPGTTFLTEDNIYNKCTLPIRVNADRRSPSKAITDIVLKGTVVDDPTTYVSIDGSMPLWTSEGTVSGTTARPTYLDDSTGTRRYSTTDSGTLGTSNPTATSGTEVSGDITLTYVGLVASQDATIDGVIVKVDAPDAETDISVTSADNVVVDPIKDWISTGDIPLLEATQTLASAITAGDAALQTQIDDFASATLNTAWAAPTATSNVLQITTADRALIDEGSGALKRYTVRAIGDTPASPLEVRLPLDAAATNEFDIHVMSTQSGTTTLKLASGSGTIDGVTGTTGITLKTGSDVFVRCESNAGTDPVYTTTSPSGTVEGATTFEAQVTLEAGILNPTVSASGTLTVAAHSGKTILTTNDVTVPVTDGFSCTIIAGGSHDVDAGGAAVSLTVGQSITVLSDGTDVYYSDIVTLNTMATS